MGEYGTFTSAVRAVLQSESTRDDMRAIGRQAADLLDMELVFEAAAAYLTQIARREHNDHVRREGRADIHSDEVVNVKGQDVLLGDTTDVDRQWLVTNRETLADGLRRRAARIREFGGAGPAVGRRRERVTSRQVIAAEHRAASLSSMASSLAALTDGIGTGESRVELDLHARMAEARRRIEHAEQTRSRYASYAERLKDAEHLGHTWAPTRRAHRELLRRFGLLPEGDEE